jgi:very-short-patch-repair endonuclease
MKHSNNFRNTLLKRRTPAEIKAAELLRREGIRVKEQKVHKVSGKEFHQYYLDLYLPDFHIGIELDGGVHNKTETRDTERDINSMSQGGILIIRFPNDAILRQSEEFLTTVKQVIKERIPFILTQPWGQKTLQSALQYLQKVKQSSLKED